MSDDQLLNISFVSTLGDIKSRPDIGAVEGGLGVRAHVPQLLSAPDVQKTLKETMASIASYLDSIAQQDNGHAFALDEVELTVQMTQNGKVTIFVADVGGSIQGGIKLKWKRKSKEAACT